MLTPGHLEPPDHSREELFARVNRLELRVDDLDQLFPSPARTSAPDEDRLAEWVAEFFAVTFTRSLGGEHRWCPRWSDHPEAVFRLTALHEAHDVLRTDSRMGDALWLRDHLDPQLAALLGARGPFALCSETRHDLPAPLPSRVDSL